MPVPEGWQPRFTEEQTRSYLEQYKGRAHLLTEEQQGELQAHAEAYQVPFYTGDFSLLDAVKQAGYGFFQGFTTLRSGDAPDNEFEAVARNIGHLAGFAPGILSGPLRAAGLATKSRMLLNAARKTAAVGEYSVPMLAANAATKRARKLISPALKTASRAQAGAAQLAAKTAISGPIAHVAEGAFHLGVASAVSSWQEGVNVMMDSFVHGAAFGGAFRTIGNLVKTDSKAAGTAIKALSGSLLQGLPSTMRGATTPEQVYDYLMGAYFGGKELPWTKQGAHKFIKKMEKKASKDAEFAVKFDPELMPEWAETATEVQNIVRKQIDETKGTTSQQRAMQWEFVKELGLEDKIPEMLEEAPSGFKTTGKFKDGEEQLLEEPHPTLHHGISGATKGADAAFAEISNELGVPFVHYVFKKQSTPKSLKGKKRTLSERELSDANEALTLAQMSLDRDISKLPKYTLDLFRRTFHVIRYANGVYAVAPIEKGARSVKGGTAWGVQMAINMRKPTHVFSELNDQWFKYDYSANHFVPMDGIPKLTSRYAGIGSREVVKGTRGYEAIRELLVDNINKPKEDKPLTADPKIESEETVAEVKSKQPGEQQELFRDIEGSPELENEGQDIGNRLRRYIGRQSVNFVNNHMKDAWQGAKVELQPGIKADLANSLQESIKTYLNRGSEVNRSEKWAKSVSEELGYELSPEARGEMRKWMTRRNLGEPVRFFSATEKGNVVDIGLMPAHTPYTKSGTPKNMVEPIKLIEEAFREAGGDPQEASMIIMDHITVKAKNGNKDLNLSRYRTNHLPKRQKGSPKLKKALSEAAWGRVLSRIFGYTARENNMYAFGGSGDKDRIYFVKFHPDTDSIQIPKIKTLLGNKFSKEYDLAETAYANKYGMLKPRNGQMTRKEAREVFRKGYASNLRYDLALNGLEATSANIKKLSGKGFIKGATAYNKRLQIYMTSAFKHSDAFAADRVVDLADGKYKYRLIEELKDKNSDINTLNSRMEESTDGAIIVRNDIVDVLNADFGNMPSGQNKSFIVSKDPKHGALLGKFMFHAAGDKQSADMLKEGLHFKVYDTAAKQKGTRKYGVDYFMNPSDIRGGGSTAATEHMLKNQVWVKQLFTSLNPTSFEPATRKIVDDIYNSVIKNRFAGETKWNEELAKYLIKPSETRLKKLMKNVDRIGVSELLDAMTKMNGPDFNRFSELAYDKITKQQMEAIDQMVMEGELESWEAQESKTELQEFNGAADNMLKRGRAVIKKARDKGEDVTGLGIYLHKHVRDWRMATMRNWIVHQVTRPKMPNSALTFMRPYDEYLMRDADGVNPRLKELETRDDIFFLDNGFQEMEVVTSIQGMKNTTLGKLWDAYDGLSKSNKAKADDVFEVIAVRVPMDSMSGAQVLKFKGFSGRKGHGILLHGRAMRAMGGADLDGDEAFVYFGDEQHGMKKAWKDVFKANKYEYLSEDGKTITPNKGASVEVGSDQGKTFRDVLTSDFNPKEAALQNSTAWQWSPHQRVEISQRAVEGRNQLSAAVSSAQVMRSAYAALLETPKKDKLAAQTDQFIFTRGRGKDQEEYRVTYNAKTDPKWQKHQRALTRAEIAFTSDPLDELGLKSSDMFLKKLWTAYFNVGKIEKRVGKKWVVDKKMKSIFDLEGWELRNGIVGDFFDMNSAYFGRNWTEGRKWSIPEIKEKGKSIYTYSERQFNTLLPKMIQTLQPVNWGDNIFARTNKEALKLVYQQANGILSNEGMESLRNALGRATLKTPYNEQIAVINDNKLWNHTVRETISGNVAKWKELVKKLPEYNKEMKEAKTRDERLKVLEEIAETGEDFLVNDLTDIITIRKVADMASLMSPEEFALFPEIHKKVEQLKSQSYLMARNRRRKGTFSNPITERDKIAQELADMLVNDIDANVNNAEWYKQMRGLERGDDISAEMDQSQIDIAIREYKDALSPKQKSLFDYLMLGSLNRGSLKALEALKEKLTKEKRWNPLTRDIFRSMVMEASRTSLSRLGYSSKAVHPTSVEQFMLEFSRLTGKMWKAPEPSKLEKEKEAAKNLGENKRIDVEKQEQFGFMGEPEIDPKVEGSQIADMSHFEGLRKGTLTKEQAKIITELTGHLKQYNNKIAQNINEIARGLLSKDINAMNADDFRAMNNFFRDLQTGTIWQRIWKSKGPPQLQKRYYYLFPETISRELMKDEIILLKRKGIFTTKDGKSKVGTIMEPSNYLTIMQNWINRANDFSVKKSEEWIHKSTIDLLFVDSITEGDALREIAIRERELPIGDYIMSKEYIAEPLRRAEAQIYKDAYKGAVKKHNYAELKDRKFTVNIGKDRVTMTGAEIVDKINEVYTGLFENFYTLISGKENALEPYIEGYYDKDTLKNPRIDYKKFIREMVENYENGKPIEMDVGIDGLRKIAKSMMIEMIPTSEKGMLARQKLEKLEIDETGRIPHENYWPHMFFDKKVAEKSLLQAIDYVRKSTLTPEEQDIQLKRLAYKHKQITGEWGSDALLEWQAWNETLDNISTKAGETSDILKWYSANQRMGSMFSRDSHIPGWAADSTVPEAYIRNLTNTYYKQFSQIMSRNLIHEFEQKAIKKGWHKIDYNPDTKQSLMTRWSNFYKLYVNDSIGNPVNVPDSMINDPKMKIAGTPYAWWADNKVREKVNGIAKFLGLVNKDLPENLQGITLQQLRHWSNLEAKYELATLLTHPKTIIANLFGGTTHTIQSTGFQNLKDARNPKWLKENLPEIKIGEETIRWDSLEDVKKFIDYHGVLPEFLTYEAGLSPDLRSAKTKEFIEEATKLISEDPKESLHRLRELNRKHKLTSSKFNKIADIFMGRPERVLRRDSFMAHYVHYWKKFQGAIKDPNHPFLIELAKRGVKATQFLYNAPNRPAFVRSALGKVMGRFQLWAWNAARFRFDTNRQMNIYGYRAGSEAYEKYKRTMGIDLFVFALANTFMYSMFDNQLPAPWNWLQDTSSWLLGDEKERDRAFFGAYPTSLAPLQLVTPPVLRLGPAALRGWLDDDYSKLADYQVWTLFPMGRVFRSAFGPNNFVENPMRIMENAFGFPLGQIHRQVTEDIPETMKAPGPRGIL